VEISIYLCTADSAGQNCHGEYTPAEQQSLMSTLQAMPQVQHVYFQSQDAAYGQFKTFFANDQAYVSTVTKADIPASFEVKLVNPGADYNIVASRVTGAAGVDLVVNEMTILDKFYKLLDGLKNAVVIVALILVVAAVLLVSKTLVLAPFNRRRETSMMPLVGGSNPSIQIPFLLGGVIAGRLGWVVAAGLLIGVKSLLLNNLQQYFSYNVGLKTSDLVEVIVLVMCVGVLLCGITSFVTLRRYLRV
jgi:cell division transport system permease protein